MAVIQLFTTTITVAKIARISAGTGRSCRRWSQSVHSSGSNTTVQTPCRIRIDTSLCMWGVIAAAITPHMHSDVSMRILHGVCTVVLLPLLWTLWDQRRQLRPVPALILAIFATVMVVVNSWITAMGMGVEFGRIPRPCPWQ